MDVSKLKDELIAVGMCDEVQDYWDETIGLKDLLELASTYIGMEFMASVKYPSADYIIANSDNMHENYGLYVNRNDELILDSEEREYYHLISCNSDVRIKDNSNVVILISQGSNIRFYIGENSKVVIFTFKCSKSSIEENKSNKVKHFKHYR